MKRLAETSQTSGERGPDFVATSLIVGRNLSQVQPLSAAGISTPAFLKASALRKIPVAVTSSGAAITLSPSLAPAAQPETKLLIQSGPTALLKSTRNGRITGS